VKLGKRSNSIKQFRLYTAFNVAILLSYQFDIYTKKVELNVNIYVQPKKGDPVTDCIYRFSKIESWAWLVEITQKLNFWLVREQQSEHLTIRHKTPNRGKFHRMWFYTNRLRWIKQSNDCILEHLSYYC